MACVASNVFTQSKFLLIIYSAFLQRMSYAMATVLLYRWRGTERGASRWGGGGAEGQVGGQEGREKGGQWAIAGRLPPFP